MANESEHIAIANRFHAALEHNLLSPTVCGEWIATIAFYKSLHVTEAVFATDPIVGGRSNHRDRLDTLKRHSRFKTLYSSYFTLWSASNVARYFEDKSERRSFSTFSDYMPFEDIQSKLLNIFLTQFETEAKKFLSDSSALVCYNLSKSKAA